MKTLTMTDKEIEANYHVDSTIEQIDSLILLLLECETDGVHGGFTWKLEIEYEDEEQ
jgi:hypothetical protein